MPTYYVTATVKFTSVNGKHITSLTKQEALFEMRGEYPGAEEYYAIRKRESKPAKPLLTPSPIVVPKNAYARRGMLATIPGFMTRCKVAHTQRMRRQFLASQDRASGSLRSYSTPIGFLAQ